MNGHLRQSTVDVHLVYSGDAVGLGE